MKNENQTSLPVQDEQVITKKRSQLKEVWRRFCRNKQAMIGHAFTADFCGSFCQCDRTIRSGRTESFDPPARAISCTLVWN